MLYASTVSSQVLLIMTRHVTFKKVFMLTEETFITKWGYFISRLI
jgi:hypothetical protein